MCIDETNIKLHDIFYGVKKRLNTFPRKKIHVEIDGVHYYRYEDDLHYEHVIHKYVVLGVLNKQLTGDWPESDDSTETEFYIESSKVGQVDTNKYVTCFESLRLCTTFARTLEEAYEIQRSLKEKDIAKEVQKSVTSLGKVYTNGKS